MDSIMCAIHAIPKLTRVKGKGEWNAQFHQVTVWHDRWLSRTLHLYRLNVLANLEYTGDSSAWFGYTPSWNYQTTWYLILGYFGNEGGRTMNIRDLLSLLVFILGCIETTVIHIFGYYGKVVYMWSCFLFQRDQSQLTLGYNTIVLSLLPVFMLLAWNMYEKTFGIIWIRLPQLSDRHMNLGWSRHSIKTGWRADWLGCYSWLPTLYFP